MKQLSISLVVILVAVLNTACSINPGRAAVEVAVYDLGAPVAPLLGAVAMNSGLSLEVRMPSWLDGTVMLYRLDYTDKQRLQQYSRARWIGSPGLMLQQRLRQLLAIAPSGASCSLRVEIDEFTQHFSSVDQSRGEVRGEVILYGKNRVLLGRLPLNHSLKTATADAAGGANALAALSTTVAESIAVWLRQQNLSSCRKAA